MFNEQINVGVNALMVENGRVLLGRRINVIGDGTWGVPGGHLEFGESAVDAVKREVLEETGLVVDELEFLHLVNNPRETTHYIHINFLVTRWHGTLEDRELHKCAEWKWFDLSALPQDMFFGHASFIPGMIEKKLFIDLPRNHDE